MAALAFGCAGFVIAYALLAAAQRIAASTTEHLALGRMLPMTGVLAALGVMVGWILAGRYPERAPRWLTWAIGVSVACILAQGLLLP